MKSLVCGIILLFSIRAFAQGEDEIKRFFDTLKLGGTYLVGKPFKSFDLKSVSNNKYSQDDLKGKITFIDFWFEACSPCIAEMNPLEDLYQKFRIHKKFQFLSITYESKKAIEELSKKYKLSYPTITTSIDSCVYLNFGKGFPAKIITGENGEILFFSFGGDTDPDKSGLSFKTNLYPLLNCLLKCE